MQAEPVSLLSLSPEPFFSVGVADGPEEHLFSHIAGAVRVRDGGVIVAVQGYHDIRRFGPNGEHLWTAGREGAGPSEFRHVELLPGCTTVSAIIAYDFRNSTITEFDGAGGLVRSDRIDWFPFGYDIACGPDGRMVMSDFVASSTTSTTFRLSQALAYVDLPDSDINVLRTDIPGQDGFQVFGDDAEHREPLAQGPRTWGRKLVFAPSLDGVWIATGDDYDVEFLDWTGSTTRRIRWLGPSRNVTSTHRNAFRERLCRGYRLLGQQNWQDLCRARWEEEEPLLPTTFPTVARLLIADDGRLWVEHFRRPGESREWLVFDNDGTWASSLQLPMRMFLQDAGRDWILVRHTTDDLDVETLAIYTITSDR